MFKDRTEAGEKLVLKLKDYQGISDAIVVGIPRGGVVPASVIAKKLNLPLELVLTKKIGHPTNPELAIGAVSLNGYGLNSGIQLPKKYVVTEINRIRDLLMKRYKAWYGDEPQRSLTNKVVILVDDGIATGSTMIAALRLIIDEKPKKVVVAVPVASKDSIIKINEYADEVVCLEQYDPFHAVGKYYEDFEQVTDQDVAKLL